MRTTILILLTFITFITKGASVNEQFVKGLELISAGQTKQGMSLLDRNFSDFDRENKIIAANILALSAEKDLSNDQSYYAKYALKFDKNLDQNQQAKLLRPLADYQFKSGLIKPAIKSYEDAIRLTFDNSLKNYLQYKLGWAYINDNKYLKMYVLWAPLLNQDTPLQTQIIHDFSKFWMEYIIEKNLYRPFPDFPIESMGQVRQGMKSAIHRFDRKFNIKRIIKTIEKTTDMNIAYAGYFITSKPGLCEFIKLDSNKVKNLSLFDQQKLKLHLDQCLAKNLDNKPILTKLRTIYPNLEGADKELLIATLKLDHEDAVCQSITSIITSSSDENALLLGIDQIANGQCILPKDTHTSVNTQFTKWTTNVRQQALGNQKLAPILITSVISDTDKQKLAGGLAGSDKFLSFVKSNPELKIKEDIFTKHIHLSKTLPLEANELASFLNTKNLLELDLGLLINKTKPFNEITSDRIQANCTNLTLQGQNAIIAHAQEVSRAELILDNLPCFSNNVLEQKNFISAITMSKGSTQSKNFHYQINQLVWNPTSYIKAKSGVNKLKETLPSLYVLNRTKSRLLSLRKYKKANMELLNKRLSYYRRLIFKTKWLNEAVKNNSISFYNSFLAQSIDRLDKLSLKAEERDILKKAFKEYEIL